MKNTLETRLGIFVALSVIAAVIIIETLGGLDLFKKSYHLHALFNTVQELKVGDRVKMAGVEVGKVEAIQIVDNKVKVTMKLRVGTPVKTDSTASVKFAGLMGQNLVSIDFGTPAGKQLVNDQFVNTIEQPDLSAIMTKLDNAAGGIENITKVFSGDKLDNILGPFTDFLKQNSVPLTATIANLRTISGQVAEGKGTIGKLIHDQELYDSAIASVTNLQATITDARALLDNVQSGQGSLGKLITDESLYRETTASMTSLREILQKINQGQGTVGRLINDQEFYKNAKLTLQKVDKATDSLEDQGPISVLSTVMGSLF